MSLTDQVYTRLKEDIFEFRLQPGERLSETDVSTRFEVSRTPVREALGRLRQEGFVKLDGRRGWSVTVFDFDAFDELYEVRVTLELHATRRIASSSSPVLDGLSTIWLADEDARLTDPAAVARLDEAFHNTLIDSLTNREMSRIYRDVTERIRIIRRLDFTKPDRVTATYEEHAAIVELLHMGQAEQACARLEAHIEASREEVKRITLHRLHTARRESIKDANHDAIDDKQTTEY